jgi:hypothetical protein
MANGFERRGFYEWIEISISLDISTPRQPPIDGGHSKEKVRFFEVM